MINAEQRCGMDVNMTDERTFWRRQYHPLPAIPPYRGGRTNFESTKHGTHLGAAIRPRRGHKAKGPELTAHTLNSQAGLLGMSDRKRALATSEIELHCLLSRKPLDLDLGSFAGQEERDLCPD